MDHSNVNVLELLTASHGGGAERLILNQMECFNKSRFNLHVMTLRPGNLELEFRAKRDAKYTCLNTKHRFSILALGRIIRYIKQHKIQVLHTHLIEADMYGSLAKMFVPRLKLVCTKHNTNEFRKRVRWGIANHLLSLPVNQIIAVSEAVKGFITKHEFVPQKKIKVIYNGIDTNRFKPQPTSELRRELGVGSGDFVVGIVGRLTHQKGHKYLFQAARMLKPKVPKLKVLVIGTGELETELKHMVKSLGIQDNVKFLGFRGDVPDLYSLMDVFCLPSLFEGLALVLAEAMASEAIVVCSDIPNNREIIDNGKDGVLVSVGDVQAIADALYDIYRNPGNYDGMRARARKKVLAKFDFKKNLREIEGVYQELGEAR